MCIPTPNPRCKLNEEQAEILTHLIHSIHPLWTPRLATATLEQLAPQTSAIQLAIIYTTTAQKITTDQGTESMSITGPTIEQTTPSNPDALRPGCMDEAQAEQLAILVQSMRPSWHARGIVSALEKEARKTDALTLTLALLHAAQNPKNQTPAILNHPGPHWDAATGKTKPKPPQTLNTLGVDTSAMCPKHPTLHSWECKACRVKTPKPANFNELVQKAVEEHRKTTSPTHPQNA